MMEALSRLGMVAAWLAVVWAAAPLAQVASAGLALMVPLVVVVVGAVLEELERHGAAVLGIALTGVAVWGLAVATWGVLGGSVLVLSAAMVLVTGPVGQ
ncbi:hypothetical protein ACGF0J_13710 [Nonomuraea sp. NPDC047897]|uniref:hypothetical protein n=1 Tax=Nonomuraea sp. NPDC047897 TaxID=3364346 RepID=UPI0037167845